MSLLMDALRKAEEAKKKAELKSKSNDSAAVDLSGQAELTTTREEPVAVPPETAASETSDTDVEDIEIDFGFDTDTGPLLDDLSSESPDPVIFDSHELSDAEESAAFEETDALATDFASNEPHQPAVTLESIDDQEEVLPEPFSTTFELQSNATPPSTAEITADHSETVDDSAMGEGLDEVDDFVTFDPGLQSFNTKTEAEEDDSSELDAVVEERERRAAQSVFTAKRSASALRRNLLISGAGMAALFVIAIGTYFYISLQNYSGISMPIDNVVSEPFVESEDELIAVTNDNADAGADIGQILVPTLDYNVSTDNAQTSSQSNQRLVQTISDEPIENAVVSADVALEAEILALQALADAVMAENEAATNSQQQPPAQIATDLAIAPVDTAPVVSEPGATVAELTPEVSTPVVAAEISTASPPSTSSSDAATSAVRSNDAPVSVPPASSSAALLQPERIGQPESSVSFVRRAAMEVNNTAISDAYAAYQRGDIVTAERLYRMVLDASPLHRNAMLGLAAIAASREDTVTALELYSRLLARDPSDPVARAGLLEIMPRGSLQQQEQELRRLQNLHPDIAALAYAVGNFMASQQRWSEAQQAYFSALRLAKSASAEGASVNPDYAFNLAVSLEHLGQSRPAATYYQEALQQATAHPAGFDVAVARQRLLALERYRNE